MELCFIEQSPASAGMMEPSGADRRIIRSHVMRGKNAGRPRKSSRRSPASVVYTSQFLSSPFGRANSASTKSAPVRQVFWNDLCLTTFPEQLDSESTKLMHRCAYAVIVHVILSVFLICAYTCTLKGSLTSVMPCFRLSFVPSSILSNRFGSTTSSRTKHVGRASSQVNEPAQ